MNVTKSNNTKNAPTGSDEPMQDNGFFFIMELTKEEKIELLKLWKNQHAGTCQL